MNKVSLINMERINAIGGLDNPDIRRIISSFAEDLSGYMLLLDRQREEKCGVEILATLHKLSGSARTCGFTGISHAVEIWGSSANPYDKCLYLDLCNTINASIEEWQALMK